MSSDFLKPLLRNALIGFALGLVVVFAAGYTLSHSQTPSTSSQH